MLQAPFNNLIITIEKKRQDMIGNFYVDTKYNPEEHVTLTGTVISIPRGIIDRIDYKGYTTEGIQPGDTVLMRYDVIHHFAKQSANDSTVYKYEMFYKGKSYWRADIIKIFGYIRDGVITMINGYVMLEPPTETTPILFMPHHLKAMPRTAAAVISHIGRPLSHLKPISAKAGDTAYFDMKKVQQYQIQKKKFLILKQTQILGIDKVV